MAMEKSGIGLNLFWPVYICLISSSILSLCVKIEGSGKTVCICRLV